MEKTNLQLSAMSSKFSQMKAVSGTPSSDYTDLLNVLREVGDVETECHHLRTSHPNVISDCKNMAGTIRFHLDALEKTFAILRNGQ